MFKKKIFFLVTLVLLIISSNNVFAIPTLQLYIEDAIFNNASETWISNSSNFKIWIIGDLAQYDEIKDVNLVVVTKKNEIGSITFAPTTATSGLLPYPGDASTPQIPLFSGSGNDTPANLASHGIYNDETHWTTYSLGDLMLEDQPTPIGNFGKTFPDNFPDYGQINVYNVIISEYTEVHFDLFGYVRKNKNEMKFDFAPFSHDAEYDKYHHDIEPPIPEPSTMLLLGSGLLSIFGLYKKN